MIINKELANQVFVLTLSSTATTYTIKFENEFTGNDYSFDLTNDESAYKFRYKQYTLPTTLFSGMTDGLYRYSIYSNEDELVDSGRIARVINGEKPNEKIIPPNKETKGITPPARNK